MRQIYSDQDLLAWHKNALLGVVGDDMPIDGNEPQCGWYERRLVKGGPFVPARIWLFQDIEDGCLVGDSKFQCEVNGRFADAEREWTWLCQNPITEARFNYMTAALQWSRDYAPDEPMATPDQEVNWLNVPIPTF